MSKLVQLLFETNHHVMPENDVETCNFKIAWAWHYLNVVTIKGMSKYAKLSYDH